MRLIDADELLGVIAEHEMWNVPDFVYESIKNAPTIDVEPVRHGKWIKQKNEGTDDPTIYGWECSVCGEGVVWRSDDDINLEKFCYNCGAKMDSNDSNALNALEKDEETT